MDEPEATISIDISQLPVQQALAVVRAADTGQQSPETVGQLVMGNEPTSTAAARFHIPIEAALTALDELNITSEPTTEEEK